ncbi:melibiase subfamily protein [Besnoitia besnoiti]|uniref:Alpha-galactosidase n=1 Tax=Besnoitia besnoiti TaxID=94643 RepID=A0A2A9MF37_BESBE|nr:melibiase subfamily protein [Besnoitia besnoiti]PFH33980.1 melibiase subfamily protein [Besnoitia besnoiti]
MDVDIDLDRRRATIFFSVARRQWQQGRMPSFAFLFPLVLAVLLLLIHWRLCPSVAENASGSGRDTALGRWTSVGAPGGRESSSLGPTSEEQERQIPHHDRSPNVELEGSFEKAENKGDEPIGQRKDIATPMLRRGGEHGPRLTPAALPEQDESELGVGAADLWREKNYEMKGLTDYVTRSIEASHWNEFDEDAFSEFSLPQLYHDKTPMSLEAVDGLPWNDSQEEMETLSLQEEVDGDGRENSSEDTGTDTPRLVYQREGTGKVDVRRNAGVADRGGNGRRWEVNGRAASLAGRESRAGSNKEGTRRTTTTRLLENAERLSTYTFIDQAEAVSEDASNADEGQQAFFSSLPQVLQEAGLQLEGLINAVREANISHSRRPNGKANIAKPLMGWNSWNTFGCDTSQLNERLIMDTALALKASGLQAAGYEYVMLDDCWSVKKAQGRGPTEPLQWDAERFPSGMPALASFLHNRGFKFGMYTDSGSRTCMGYIGSGGHEDEDALAFQSWGVDFLKIDGCYADPSDMKALYSRWSPAFAKAAAASPDNQQKVVLNCSWPAYVHDITEFDFSAIQGMCDMWRVFDDIEPTWESLSRILTFWGDNQEIFSSIVAPGSFNDPDMLEVGNRSFSAAEGRTQISVWSILAAPLILGNDVRTMTSETLQILTHPEILAVNQDDMVFGGLRVLEAPGALSIWMRPLSGGSTAVALVNLSSQPLRIVIELPELQRAYWESWLPWTHPKLLRILNRLPVEKQYRLTQTHFPPLKKDKTKESIGCHVRDLWLRIDLGFMEHAIVSPYILDPHDTFMVSINGCKPAGTPYLFSPSGEEKEDHVFKGVQEAGGEHRLQTDDNVQEMRTEVPNSKRLAGKADLEKYSEPSAPSSISWTVSASTREEISLPEAGIGVDEMERSARSAESSAQLAGRPAAGSEM